MDFEQTNQLKLHKFPSLQYNFQDEMELGEFS